MGAQDVSIMELNHKISPARMDVESSVESDPGKFSLNDFLVGDSKDPLKPPPVFTRWHEVGAWAIELYEPQLLGPAEARTTLQYGGKSHQVINLCSYNYLGLANHPEVIASAQAALA